MSPKRISMGGESLAFAVLASGAFVILGVDEPFTAIGIALMGLGWCRWLIVNGRAVNPAADRQQVMRRCSWIASSTVLMVAGSLGLWLLPSLAATCVVMLLVGASTWCLVTGHDAVIVAGESRQSWTSLLIAGGLSRCAALMLVVQTVQELLSRESTSDAISNATIECLMIASATSCVIGVARLWNTRRQHLATQVLASIVPVQTSIVLGLLAAMAWTLLRSKSDQSPIFTPLGAALPMTLLLWDSLLIAAYSGRSAWSLSRRNRVSAILGSIFLLDLAAVPPLPGFWLKWWSLENCLSPHHIEPFAGMFDLHEGFCVLSIMLTGAQAVVTFRLLTALFNQQSAGIESSKTSPADARKLSSPIASISHE